MSRYANCISISHAIGNGQIGYLPAPFLRAVALSQPHSARLPGLTLPASHRRGRAGEWAGRGHADRQYALRVEIQSLGYRTDLTIRALEGSIVQDHGDHLLIRTPCNPAYWWGNFLLIPELKAGQASGRLERFAAEVPGARHVAIGVDETDSAAVDPAELIAVGLEFSSDTVLTASHLRPPPRPSREASFRALAGDDDWRQAARLRAAVSEGLPGSEPEFLDAKLSAERAMIEQGHGTCFGAFLDGELAAQLSVIADAATGLARYQNVETHPGARRRGLAGTLVWHAGQATLAAGRAKTLVIVAEPAADAIRLYRRVGFARAQDQIGFTRQPAG